MGPVQIQPELGSAPSAKTKGVWEGLKLTVNISPGSNTELLFWKLLIPCLNYSTGYSLGHCHGLHNLPLAFQMCHEVPQSEATASRGTAQPARRCFCSWKKKAL